MKAWTSLLLFICITISLITINVQVPVQRTDKQIDALRREFAWALSTSRTSLTALASKIMADQVVSQNLEWNLTNSVSKFLEGNLQPGQIDELVVYGPGCHPIAAASNIPLPSGPCIVDLLKNANLPAFVWQNVGPIPLLSYISQPNLAGASYYFVASVMLDKKWLSDHPDLANIVTQLEAKISSHDKTSGTILLENGQTIDGHPAATVSSANLLVRISNYIVNKAKINLAGLASFWHLMALSEVALLLLIWHLQIQQTRKRQDRLLDFCSKLAPLDPCAAHTASVDKSIPSPIKFEDQIRQHIERALVLKAEQQSLLEKELAALIRQHDSTENELMSTKELLLHSKHHESLASQMQLSTQCFIDKLNNIRIAAENTHEGLVHGITSQAVDTFSIITQWQNSLKSQSPRKFLRSLAETVHADGENELDKALQTLAKNSANLTNQSISLAESIRTLIDNMAAVMAIADHWHTLSKQTNTAINTYRLEDLLDESNQLVQMIPNLPSYRLNVQFAAEIAVENLRIPKVTITSAFYHLYLCLLETAKTINLNNLSLRVTSKQKADHKFLIISIANVDKETIAMPIHVIKQAQHHYDIADSLLHPFNIKLIKLPTVEGLAAIMMSWHESVKGKYLPSQATQPAAANSLAQDGDFVQVSELPQEFV